MQSCLPFFLVAARSTRNLDHEISACRKSGLLSELLWNGRPAPGSSWDRDLLWEFMVFPPKGWAMGTPNDYSMPALRGSAWAVCKWAAIGVNCYSEFRHLSRSDKQVTWSWKVSDGPIQYPIALAIDIFGFMLLWFMFLPASWLATFSWEHHVHRCQPRDAGIPTTVKIICVGCIHF